MTTAKEIVEELKTLGSESIKKVLRNHGVKEPFFGVQDRRPEKDREADQEGLSARARSV